MGLRTASSWRAASTRPAAGARVSAWAGRRASGFRAVWLLRPAVAAAAGAGLCTRPPPARPRGRAPSGFSPDPAAVSLPCARGTGA